MTMSGTIIALQTRLDRFVYPRLVRSSRRSAALRVYAAVASRIDPVASYSFWAQAQESHASAARYYRSRVDRDPHDIAEARAALVRIHSRASGRAADIRYAIERCAPSVSYRSFSWSHPPTLAAVADLEAIVATVDIPF